MGVHFIQAFLPDVETPEATKILERELGPAGYRVEEQFALEDGTLYPALKRYPGAAAFILFSRPRDAISRATLLTTIPAPERRWDPALARAMSREVGGYAVALESWSGGGQYGFGVFYAGRTVEINLFDYRRRRTPGEPLDEEQAQAAYLRHWKALSDGIERELWPAPTVRPQAWIVRDLRPLVELAPPDPISERNFSRAVFGPVEDEAEFRAAFEQLAPSPPASLRWLRTAYEGGVPYVLLDHEGPLDDVLVTELARRLDVFFAAVEFAGPRSAFRWLDGNGAAVERGTGQGALELEELWRGFSACMGVGPACIRWPQGSGPDRG